MKPPGFRRNERAGSLTEPENKRGGGPESPRRQDEREEYERRQDIGDSVPDEGTSRRSACEIEEEASVGPLFKARHTRHNDGNRAQQLPNAHDRREVHGVAEVRQRGHHLRVAREVKVSANDEA